MKKVVLLSVIFSAIIATSCDTAAADEGFKTNNEAQAVAKAQDSVPSGDIGGQGAQTPIKP